MPYGVYGGKVTNALRLGRRAFGCFSFPLLSFSFYPLFFPSSFYVITKKRLEYFHAFIDVLDEALCYP